MKRYRLPVFLLVFLLAGLSLIARNLIKELQQTQHFAHLRAQIDDQLERASQLDADGHFDDARTLLARAQGTLDALPELDTGGLRERIAKLQRQVESRLDHLKESSPARDRLTRFKNLRDEALFHATPFTALDLASNRGKTGEMCQAALSLYALGGNENPAEDVNARLERERKHLSEGDHTDLVAGCYELLLVWADSLATEKQVAQALVVLERASRLGADYGIKTQVPAIRKARYEVLARGEAIALAQDDDKVITNSVSMKLALIPAGKFVMGSPAAEEERDAEELQHEVVIAKPFYLGVHEVTQEQYQKVTGKNPSAYKSGPSFPVEKVSWNDAAGFCRQLSALADEKKAGRVYRLPTEAEWEYACRAGTTTVFHVGNTLASQQANFDGNAPYGNVPKGPNLQKPAKVGSYAPNAWGLYDMHGNVAEWCSDWYDPDYYKTSPKEDPKGPAKGVLATTFGNDFFHVVRGGCWLDDARACRAAYRFRLQSTEPYQLVGLRVVCEQKR